MKRPATKPSKPSKGVKINETISKLRRGVSKEDLVQNKKVKEEDEAEDGRDKSKGQKYAKMKHLLPDHIVDLVEKESAKTSSPREFKTLVINKLFVRDSKGKLTLNLSDHMFEEHKKIFTKRYAKERDHALPETVKKGHYFQNNEAAWQRAVDAGDVEEVDVGGGKSFWAFKSFEKGKVHGTVDEQSMKGTSKINKEQSKMLAGAFKAVKWTWNYKEKDAQKLMNGANSQAKLAKEAGLIIKQWTHDKSDDRLSKLKKGHAVCNQNIAKLNHMREFHELPDDLASTKDNLDQVMVGMASHTADFNELIETTRGVLKAHKK
eukprot:Skav236193  [mRNA]  locus=scaffold1795:8678:9637:+ [translate_table: standard]